VTKRVFKSRAGMAALVGAAALALAATPFVSSRFDGVAAGVIASAYAQDHGADAGGGHTTEGGSSGGSESGGHTGGAGLGGGEAGGHAGGRGSDAGSHAGGAGGGHDGGSSGGGHGGAGGPQYKGGEHPQHGTIAEHEGHASGVHGQSHDTTAHGAGTDRGFGGGSGLAGLEQVPEGPARMRYTYEFGEQYSFGAGPGAKFRYWGGWVIPGEDEPGDEPTTVADTSLSTGGGGPSAVTTLQGLARCDDVGGSTPSAVAFSARNVQRASAAREILAPADLAEGTVPSPYLMVSFQEELQKPKPDALVAGTYLGLVAKVPVTEEVVKQVAWRMCVPVADAQAEAIAHVAEVQRSADTR
jgi:hypothetical protein